MLKYQSLMRKTQNKLCTISNDDKTTILHIMSELKGKDNFKVKIIWLLSKFEDSPSSRAPSDEISRKRIQRISSIWSIGINFDASCLSCMSVSNLCIQYIGIMICSGTLKCN